MKKSKLQILLFFSIIALISCSQKTIKKVPIINKKIASDQTTIDTLDFRNQLNEVYQISNTKGKIHIVNFFFTNCKTICPLMEIPLNKLAQKYNKVQFLSFTIDPERDQVEVLDTYHKLHKTNNQTLLRGSKEDLDVIASYYLSPIATDDIESLYHTSYVVLVDENMYIRGLYNSLDRDDLLFLEKDLNILLKAN